MSATIDLTTRAFETFIDQNEIVVVDFWASWCAPCRQFGETYEEVAASHPTVKFTKVNVEKEQKLAQTFQISSIPHVAVFKQGILIYSEAGSMPVSTLNELVQQAIDADVNEIRQNINDENV